jgi:hypothetical protein
LSSNVKVKIDKTIIQSLIFYGCETWSLALREEHRLRVFENGFLRRTSGLKRDEVTGEWKKLHNEELHILYPSPNVTARSNQGEWGGHGMWHAWGREKSVQGFGGKAPKERHHSEGRVVDGKIDGIRMDHREIRWGYGVDSVGSG